MRHIIAIIMAALSAFAAARAQQLPMRLWYDCPAEFFEQSLPIGNGTQGAMVYGDPSRDMLQLNDITLWTGNPVSHDEDAGAAHWIPEIRRALFAEDYARADSLQLNVQGHNSSHYQPLGTLTISDIGERAAVSGYCRSLSLDSALATVSYTRGGTTFHREYLASAPDSLIAVRLTASEPHAINVELSLHSLLPHSVRSSASQLTMTGHAVGDERETVHFATIVQLDETDGTIGRTDSTLTLRGATEATVYIVSATSFNGAMHHPVMQGAPYLSTVANRAWHTRNTSYAEIRQRHVDDYRHYFCRQTLRLGDAATMPKGTTDSILGSYATGNVQADKYLETLYYQYGRYLLISCSRTSGVPANLQGLWNPHLWAPWRGNYTMNINLEENYWPAFTANLAEMSTPLDSFITALADNGRHTSLNYYGIRRGWSAGHNSDLWAMANPVGEKNEKPEWANWAMGGAWLVTTLWERYLFTQDETHLRTVAYPLMRSAAEFCLDWLMENPNNPDELITAPSTSPENEYVNDKGYHGMTVYGSTADMAIIRELFTSTLGAAAVLGDTTGVVSEIRAALPRLHPYTIGHEGDLNEWYYDWQDKDPKHRHQSHLIGLYPGHHILDGMAGEKSPSPEALLAACQRTLEQKGDHTTGWSTGWRINLWARLHRADQAYHILQKLLTYVSPDNYKGSDRRRPGGGTYPNLFDAHPPFQIDGNFGGTAGIAEMLVQSRFTPGQLPVIELLPALPRQWADGEVRGLCARGGYEVDMKWRNAKPMAITIRASRSGRLVVAHGNKTLTVSIKAGKSKRVRL